MKQDSTQRSDAGKGSGEAYRRLGDSEFAERHGDAAAPVGKVGGESAVHLAETSWQSFGAPRAVHRLRRRGSLDCESLLCPA